MSASALSARGKITTPSTGLRAVNLRQDLGQIADLVELVFGATMDSGGRAAVREMRALGRAGPLIWLLASLDRGIRAMNHGFVWIAADTHQLVGNVSVYDAGYDSTLVIANVAVHPDYRRRGIAWQMMEAALTMASQQKAHAVLLQVEADNYAAQQLYEKLGFRKLRTFTRWRRRLYTELPKRLLKMPDITLRSGREWKIDYELALQLRPNQHGGLGWLRPTEPKAFRKSLLGHLLNVISPKRIQRWVIRDPENPDQLLASMAIEIAFGVRHCRTDVLVTPEKQGQLEAPLLNFAIRHLADYNRGLLIDHPSDDLGITAVFKAYDFEAIRHLTYMQWLPEA